MSDHEIKKANRKAMPKFILIMVISLVAGGGIGFFSAKYGLDTLAGGIEEAEAFFGRYIAPWLMLAVALLVPIVSVPLYEKAKKLLSSWTGEEEELSDAIDKKLNLILWLTSAALILSFFLIAASYAGGFSTFEDGENALSFFVGIAAFFAILIEAVILQQKCVDAAKKTNPEKTASVYDPKFQKKWLESCDEAEKLMIGKCSFQAYMATNTACMVLAVVLAICALIFGIGFLPSLVVCLIWLVNQSVYCREAIRFAKSGNKLS